MIIDFNNRGKGGSGGGGSTIVEKDGILTADGKYDFYTKDKTDLEIAESIEGLEHSINDELEKVNDSIEALDEKIEGKQDKLHADKEGLYTGTDTNYLFKDDNGYYTIDPKYYTTGLTAEEVKAGCVFAGIGGNEVGFSIGVDDESSDNFREETIYDIPGYPNAYRVGNNIVYGWRKHNYFYIDGKLLIFDQEEPFDMASNIKLKNRTRVFKLKVSETGINYNVPDFTTSNDNDYTFPTIIKDADDNYYLFFFLDTKNTTDAIVPKPEYVDFKEQEYLTKFKKINGESLLGDGNIEIAITENDGVLTNGTYEWYSKNEIDFEKGNIPNNEIWYKTTTGRTINIGISGLSLLSNTYEDGVGKLVYSGDVTTVDIVFLTTLKSIKFPETLTSVGKDFLFYCSNLTSIDLSNTKLETVGSGFLGDNGQLTSVKLPETLTTVGEQFLDSAAGLTSIDLSNTKLETVGNYFLSGCTGLTSVKLPNTITSIGGTSQFLMNNKQNGVLYYPSSKKDDPVYKSFISALPSSWTSEAYDDGVSGGGGSTITETNGVLTDGTYEWYSKEEIDLKLGIPNNEIWYTTSDGNIITSNIDLVDGVSLLSNTYENGVGKLVYSGDITSVTDNFLRSNSKLTSIKLPDTLTTVGNYFLQNCSSLTSIKLPETLTTVGGFLLSFCGSLTSVDLSNTKLETVGNYFLFSCTSMTSVKLPNTITSFDTNSFLNGNSKNGVLYYPSSKKDDSVYQSIISALPSSWRAETYGFDASAYYTKEEIDSILGNIDTLLSNI